MKTTNEIKQEWSAYDKAQAQCSLANYGTIYLDEYGLPMESEEIYYQLGY